MNAEIIEDLTSQLKFVDSDQIPRSVHLPYLVLILSVSVLSLISLTVESLATLDNETRNLIQYFDNFICIIFFIDFLISFLRAENRVQYFFRGGWLDLISSIPTVDALRFTRAVRITRLLRVLRGLRSAHLFVKLIMSKKSEAALLSTFLSAIILVFFCSIAILQFETTPEANIRTAADALWWSVTTITTVGYGDRYPFTPEGRLVACVLMVGGVGLFGVLSGSIASWILGERSNANMEELEMLRNEVAQLRNERAQRFGNLKVKEYKEIM